MAKLVVMSECSERIRIHSHVAVFKRGWVDAYGLWSGGSNSPSRSRASNRRSTDSRTRVSETAPLATAFAMPSVNTDPQSRSVPAFIAIVDASPLEPARKQLSSGSLWTVPLTFAMHSRRAGYRGLTTSATPPQSLTMYPEKLYLVSRVRLQTRARM
jgi:hypothetical protein